ncbi:MAG: type II toxin-antitoxin system RelE/ParE family toxin [Defluviitaleaceae bacterium]|nr:type II toxin-antitoxin system RelE/ParE family toxin [Defluviitaleaceae bacterium]
MDSKEYTLRTLRVYERDMLEVAEYISNVLSNPEAALRLINETQKAVQQRLLNPTAFEPYRSSKNRKHKYYRIYVKNYTVFYVVIGNVMELHRFIYNRRDFTKII